MAESNKKAEQRGCVKVGGREYVRSSVFAQRVGIAKCSVTKAVKDGRLTRVKLEGYQGEWLDWNVSRARFAKQRAKQKQGHVPGGSREKKDARLTNTSEEIKPVGLPSTGGAGDVGVPEIPKAAEGILSYFNPEDPDNADCWETDDYGDFLMIPHTDPPRHSVDWKKAIDKCMANIRYQQYQKERRELIPRAEVEQSLSLVFPPITAVIMQMPDKYASRINGRVEEIIGRPMTNEETTLIRAILSDEAERICHNLQDAVQKALEND